MEQTQAEATRVRNASKDEGLRRDINEMLFKSLEGWTTLAEMEMISDRVFGVIDSWNGRSPRLPQPPRAS